MQFEIIENLKTLEKAIKSNNAMLAYFSKGSCNVAEALFPKVSMLIENQFPRIALYLLVLDNKPEIAEKYEVFTEPTILVFFEGKEWVRKSRNFGLEELEYSIRRPYQLIFSD